MSLTQTRVTLSAAELRALAIWKARYILEAQGFTHHESDRLHFLRWLTQTNRIARN